MRSPIRLVEANYDNWKRNSDRIGKITEARSPVSSQVPRTAVLNEIETVNGSVTVSEIYEHDQGFRR